MGLGRCANTDPETSQGPSEGLRDMNYLTRATGTAKPLAAHHPRIRS
jgi:hypothetical protein